MRNFYCLLLVLWAICCATAFAQVRLSAAPELVWQWVEVPVYALPNQDARIYTGQYEQGTLAPARTPKPLAADAQITRIDLVFTRYRNDTTQWNLSFDRLMSSRLTQLLARSGIPVELLPSLELRVVGQTACPTAASARAMFHGAVVYYQPSAVQTPAAVAGDAQQERTAADIRTQATATRTHTGDQVPNQRTGRTRRSQAEQPQAKPTPLPRETPSYPDSLGPLNAEGIPTFFWRGAPIKKMTEGERFARQNMGWVERIILDGADTGDSSITTMLREFADENGLLVVADWTGSMYNYGAQVLKILYELNRDEWLKAVVLFNDGDDFKRADPFAPKPLANAGGVYFIENFDPDSVLALMGLVMMRGNGGLPDENNIEAILTAQGRYPRGTYSRLVMIGDNNAAIRDISLASRIKGPVDILVANASGYKVQAQFIYLAWLTGGSVRVPGETLQFDKPNYRRQKVYRFAGCEYEQKSGGEFEIRR